MSDLWALLDSHYPDETATYKSLQTTVTSLEDGDRVLPLDDLMIPAIQPLRSLFHFTDSHMMGAAPVRQDLVVVKDFIELATKMELLRDVVSGTSKMTVNAWKKLESLQYNANLMEFFTQDFTRVYLQSINVHSDDPLERRRRCGLLMTALVDRVESSETV